MEGYEQPQQYNPAHYGPWRFENSSDGNTLKLWHPKLSETYVTAPSGAPFTVKKESCWYAWFQFDEESFPLEDLAYLVRIYFQAGWIAESKHLK